jgi:hypothetical protein
MHWIMLLYALQGAEEQFCALCRVSLQGCKVEHVLYRCCANSAQELSTQPQMTAMSTAVALPDKLVNFLSSSGSHGDAG